MSDTPPSDWTRLLRDAGVKTTTSSIDVIAVIAPGNLEFMVGHPLPGGYARLCPEDYQMMLYTIWSAVRYAQSANKSLHLPGAHLTSTCGMSSRRLPAEINEVMSAYAAR